MGLIGRVLKFLRSTENGAHVADVELELSDGDRVTARHFSSPGDDSPPLKSDRLVVIELPGVTEAVVVGYLMSVESLAELGEKRLFARGDDGAPAMAVWLKKTGGGSGGDQPSLELGLNPTDRVACADPTQQAIDKIFAALNALAAAVPNPTPDSGAALHTAFTTAWGSGTPPEQPPTVASETVKVQP